MTTESIILIGALLLVAGMLLNSSGGTTGDVSGSGGAGNSGSPIAQLAAAITKAEGSPAHANNPGDLALGDQGNGVLNSAGVTIFSTFEEGLNALYSQITKVFTGTSKYYSPSMTWAEFAQQWTGGDNSSGWLATVVQELGVDPNSTIGEWLGSQSS